MIHDNTALTVSEDEATRAEEEVKRRLITSKKLSLVVDLDQTIIHATVDPTVAEWQKDPDNPNFKALKDVRAFQLVDDGPGGRGTWYYIKLRPGLQEFLERISKLYELHIYTMGTRAYAQHIAELVDPNRKVFGDRILSRDESGSMVAKNLQRLFPVDTNMVVVIDDRGDVWSWNPNLIKVTQFSFFTGIGDINASFLPKRQPKIRSSPKPSPPTNTELPNVSSSTGGPSLADSDSAPQNPPEKQQPSSNPTSPTPSSSALEQLVAMAAGSNSNPVTLQEQTAKQDEALNAQLQDRPLLQMQQKLDAAEDIESDSENDARPRQHLLNDDDCELLYLEQSLGKVHTEFFAAYASRMADAKGGRVTELRGSSTSTSSNTNGSKRLSPSANLDLTLIPDIKVIMPNLKQRVLAGVSIVFSGVIPLDMDPQSAEISVWSRSFGARIQDRISSRSTTHVVAARNRTAKVRQAVRKGKGRIKVVGVQWLMDCIVQWKKLDEAPYLMSTGEGDVGRPLPGELEEEEAMSESEDVSSSHNDTDTDANATENEDAQNKGRAPRQRLRLNIKPPPTPLSAQKMNGPGTHSSVANAGDAQAGHRGVEPLSAALLDPAEEAEMENDKSPVGGTDADWKSMHDEMAEFLGSDLDDDDDDDRNSETESMDSLILGGQGKNLKRGRRVEEEEAQDGEDGDGGGRSKDPSPLRKKVKSQLGIELESGLVTTLLDGGGDSKDAANGEGGDDGVDDDEDGDGWSAFGDGDDLEREMEKAAAEGAEDDDLDA